MWPNASDDDASAHYKVLLNSHMLYDIFLRKKDWIFFFGGDEMISFCYYL